MVKKMFQAVVISAAICQAAPFPATVGLADVLAHPASYVGQEICVTGSVTPGPGMCTLMACSIENPCCNSCGGQPYVRDGTNSLLVKTDNQTLAAELSCTWKDCEQPHCAQFDTAKDYVVQGTLRQGTGAGAGYYLDYAASWEVPSGARSGPGMHFLSNGPTPATALYDLCGRKMRQGVPTRGVCLAETGAKCAVRMLSGESSRSRE